MTMRPFTEKQSMPMTLALRVQYLREGLGYTKSRLADACNLPDETIEDIESGLQLFLSPSIRQKLARGLRVRASVLSAVEKNMPTVRRTYLSEEGRERYIEEMLHYPDAEYPCPACGTLLEVRIFQRRDLEDNLLIEVKAHCPRCLFKL